MPPPLFAGTGPAAIGENADMFSRKFRRKPRGDFGIGFSGSGREAIVIVNLSDSWRGHMCSEEFVGDLCDRVMVPALEELDRCFGAGWCREIAPSLVLEGPSLGFKLTIVELGGWRLMDMNTRVGQVFNKHWELEIDRVPPR